MKKPTEPYEWQAQADMAFECLKLDQAGRSGLIKPIKVNVKLCQERLAEAKRLGILPHGWSPSR
jgi:hypothetical protein